MADGLGLGLREVARCLLLVAAMAAMSLPVLGKEAALVADDPALEARVQRVSAELRCLVCQNQTIADSHAELAQDLRRQVREMLQRGDSERQIVEYMTARYGDFVLYRPPLKATTAALWFGPPLMLVAGLVLLVVVLRQRSRMAADQFEPDEPAEIDAVESALDAKAERKQAATGN